MGTEVLAGLTSEEVGTRRAEGHTNALENTTSRSFGEIVRANVLTRFNAILGSLLAVILLVGEPRDGLFGIVLVTNALVGIVQELKAKRTLDKLALLSAPRARVIRDGAVTEVATSEVVLDDVIELQPGDEIVVDGEILDSRALEVDESLLTGESDTVPKHEGDEALSGSFVAVGSGHLQATAVGPDAYANRLSAEARKFELVSSELRGGIDRILRVVQYLLVPTGILLVWSQLTSGEGFRQAMQGSVAGVGSMIPEGLVLLTSVAFAVGVIRLGRRRVLTQELAAIEGLARVDVVCLDKTGTITEPVLEVSGIEPLDGRDGAALGALAASDPNPNASLQAIQDAFPRPDGWDLAGAVPFSSAAQVERRRVRRARHLVPGRARHPPGAHTRPRPDPRAGRGARRPGPTRRAVGRRRRPRRRAHRRAPPRTPGTGHPGPPRGARPRRGARHHRLLRDAERGGEGHLGRPPATVGTVASRVGVPGAENPFDARELPGGADELATVLEERSVFGRVTPQQKRAMVHALQSHGHTVAMTGDGVNDVLALKDADIGVAMGSGAPATRSVARFVFLDNSFASFPAVVAEGRRVIANVERVANLFITKTIYAMLLSLAVGVAGLAFPFFPRHLTIISSLTIGIPAFFLALAPNARRYRPGFLSRVMRFAIPSGTIAATATFAGYLLAEQEGTLEEARTTATIVLFLVALWVLTILTAPFNPWKTALVGSMAGVFVLALALPFTGTSSPSTSRASSPCSPPSASRRWRAASSRWAGAPPGGSTARPASPTWASATDSEAEAELGLGSSGGAALWPRSASSPGDPAAVRSWGGCAPAPPAPAACRPRSVSRRRCSSGLPRVADSLRNVPFRSETDPQRRRRGLSPWARSSGRGGGGGRRRRRCTRP
ncbi:MAG: HAD-IC family P-type ATPase [Acidimicrobiia bacterium]|nr:HAD-IC family P-type ATPase [Acidimicrobiia bacterium]